MLLCFSGNSSIPDFPFSLKSFLWCFGVLVVMFLYLIFPLRSLRSLRLNLFLVFSCFGGKSLMPKNNQCKSVLSFFSVCQSLALLFWCFRVLVVMFLYPFFSLRLYLSLVFFLLLTHSNKKARSLKRALNHLSTINEQQSTTLLESFSLFLL